MKIRNELFRKVWHNTRLALWISMLFMATGCASVIGHSNLATGRMENYPYCGTATDLHAVTLPFRRESYKAADGYDPDVRVLFGAMFFGIIDAPLSFIADTLFLPFDLFAF